MRTLELVILVFGCALIGVAASSLAAGVGVFCVAWSVMPER